MIENHHFTNSTVDGTRVILNEVTFLIAIVAKTVIPIPLGSPSLRRMCELNMAVARHVSQRHRPIMHATYCRAINL